MAVYYGSGATPTSNVAGTIPLQTRRKYGMTDKVIMKEYASAPLLAALSKRMQKSPVTDPEFKVLEDSYPTMDGTLQGCTAAGVAAALAVTTDYVKIASADNFLQPGDVITVPAVQTNQTNSSANIAGENMVIVRVFNTGASAYCQVARDGGNGGISNTYGISAGSGSTLSFGKIAPAFQEGSAAPEAQGWTMEAVTNYVQRIRYTWEITDELEATELYGGNELARKRRNGRSVTMRLVERMLLSGHKFIKYVNGKPKRFSGGALWYLGGAYDIANGSFGHTAWSTANDLVTGNGTSRVWKITDSADISKWSIDKFLLFMQKTFTWGGKTKVGFAGGNFVYKFQGLFQNMIRLENDPTWFGIEVMKFKSPWGTLPIMEHGEMTHGGLTNWLIILDMDYFGYRFLRGRDLKVETKLQANGVHARKEGMTGVIGTALNFWESHSAAVIVV